MAYRLSTIVIQQKCVAVSFSTATPRSMDGEHALACSLHTACLPRHVACIRGSCLSLNRPSRAKPCVDDEFHLSDQSQPKVISTLRDDCAIQAPNPPLHQWVTCKYTRSHSHGSNHLYPLKGGWPWPNKCYRASGWTHGSSHPVSAWVRGCFLFGPCTPSPIPQNHSCVTMMGSLHVGATFPMNTWHAVPMPLTGAA